MALRIFWLAMLLWCVGLCLLVARSYRAGKINNIHATLFRHKYYALGGLSLWLLFSMLLGPWLHWPWWIWQVGIAILFGGYLFATTKYALYIAGYLDEKRRLRRLLADVLFSAIKCALQLATKLNGKPE